MASEEEAQKQVAKTSKDVEEQSSYDVYFSKSMEAVIGVEGEA